MHHTPTKQQHKKIAAFFLEISKKKVVLKALVQAEGGFCSSFFREEKVFVGLNGLQGENDG